uniref:Uncharacterized protein n=1 Tax=Arundo donax TaxID=35708 RepID=A0A0A9HC22_ARUDO
MKDNIMQLCENGRVHVDAEMVTSTIEEDHTTSPNY